MPKITSVTLKNKMGKIAQICLDGVLWRKVPAEVVVRFGLREGLELEEVELEKIALEDEFVRGRNIAARLLELRPRSEFEVRVRLKRKDLSQASIKRVLTYFRDKGALDDEAFVKRFALNQIKSARKTPVQIITALIRRGFSYNKAENLVRELYPLELEIDLSIKRAEKKTRSLKNKKDIDKVRNIRADLIKHGFQESAVDRAILKIKKTL